MKKLLRFFKKLFIVFVLLVVSFFIFAAVSNYRQNLKIKREIREGRIQYCKKVGWIDWGHAIPTGPLQLVKDVLSKDSVVTYFQQMSTSFLGMKLVVRAVNTYKIPTNLSKVKQEGVIRFIFEDVSNEFETIQSSLALRYVSGNDIGDRNGDKIALLRALGKTWTEDSMLLKPVSPDTALRIFKTNETDIKKNENFFDHLLDKKIAPCIIVKKVSSKIEYIFETKN